MIFQTVPIDQVGRSLKAVSRGALTGLGLGPGLQVAAQGAPKVVLGAMSLSPLPSWVQMCPGLVAAASTKVQKHVPSYGFPPPCKQAALGTSHLGTSHQIHTPPPPPVSALRSREAWVRHSPNKPPCSLDSEVSLSVAICAGLMHLHNED